MKLSAREQAFREQDAQRERLRQIINDPVFRAAVDLLRERYRSRFAIVNPGVDPALALALQQAYLTGANEFPDVLAHLSEAPSNIKPPPLVEWGTLVTPDKLYEHTSTTSTTNTSTDGASGTGGTKTGRSRSTHTTRGGNARGKSA